MLNIRGMQKLKSRAPVIAGPRQSPVVGWIAPCLVFTLISLAAVGPLAAKTQDRWKSAHFRDHPLIGSIWNAKGEKVTPARFRAAVADAKYVLLGEIHTNPDHHRLQTEVLSWLVASGRKPAVIFEMVPMAMQGELDDAMASEQPDLKKLGGRLRWSERGWPDWSMYEPIFATALSADLRLVSGGIERSRIRQLMKAENYDELVRELNLRADLSAAALAEMERTIEEAHCNMLPKQAISSVGRVQRARDARLAKSVLAGNADNGAVLIAGHGHVRRDWGVAGIIQQNAPEARTVAVRLAEVVPDKTSIRDYSNRQAELQAPFDFTYFTPRAELKDHCEDMRKHMKRKRQKDG